jgi:SAM-dependent methyltransferase
MNFLKNYSHYYNLIYQDKDYVVEVNYTLSLLNKHQPNLESILEFGCGTGNHALILAEKGYQIDGFDLSAEMIAIANEKLQKLPQDIASRVSFKQGDLRTICIEKQYDVVIALFHVMSYQISNEDLSAAFATAKNHLKPGGIFLFDCWYGPGVLSDRPVTRVKRLEDEHTSIVRIAEPVMFPDDNLVDVNYQIFINHKQTATQENFRETHRMRYLFKPEVRFFLEKHQLELLDCYEENPSPDRTTSAWSVYFIAKS